MTVAVVNDDSYSYCSCFMLRRHTSLSQVSQFRTFKERFCNRRIEKGLIGTSSSDRISMFLTVGRLVNTNEHRIIKLISTKED